MLCGIDEAGRGPIAGPLVMCGAILPHPIEGLRDSKKLSEKKRELLFETVIQSATYHVAIFSAQEIDDHGISHCLKSGLEEIMSQLKASSYLFDGNTTFGVQGLETLIKADDQIEEVKAASIIAKVTRDRMMRAYDALYPEYGFAGHKGYGSSKKHIEAIRAHGYCDLHRRSYKIKALEPTLF